MKYWHCIVPLTLLSSSVNAQIEAILYDDSLADLPALQPWLLYADDAFLNDGDAVQMRVSSGVNLITDVPVSGGYGNYIPFFGVFKNANFPALDRMAGYDIDFELQINGENHVSNDRAGFSVIAVSNDLRGIEIGFWENEIWAQGDDPIFTHAEGAMLSSTAADTQYRLSIRGEGYELSAAGNSVLTGPLRDYSAFGQPYDLPSFLFFGDDTGRAGADVVIGRIAITTDRSGTLPLQAGDADQDLDVDQLDLVQVQVGARYLTGQPATWGEGDWDGAPGGKQGEPPAGDGRFDQRDIIATLSAGFYLTGPYGARSPDGVTDGAQASIGYDANTGRSWADAPSRTELTSVNIDSAFGISTGDAARNLGGSVVNDADNDVFKVKTEGSFGAISLGNVDQANLSEEFVLDDLTEVGSLSDGGDLGAVELINVPEPPTTLLVLVGTLAMVAVRRRR